MWALRSLGVWQVIAASAVGSLTASYGHGTLAVPDQLVDRTSGREQTFFDSGVVHVAFAAPYSPVGRARERLGSAQALPLRHGQIAFPLPGGTETHGGHVLES